MNWRVMIISSVSLTEIKLGTKSCTLYAWNWGTKRARTVASHYFNQNVQNYHFSQKNHGISVLGSQKRRTDRIFAADHQGSKVLWDPKKLRKAIQNKRRGLLTSGVCLLHDNAGPHTANVTKQFGRDVFYYLPPVFPRPGAFKLLYS